MQPMFSRMTTQRVSLRQPFLPLLRQLSYVLCLALPLPSLASPADSVKIPHQAESGTTSGSHLTASNNAAKTHSGYAGHTWYQSFGKGRPILIINGGPGLDSAGFAGLAQAIAAAGYQAIIYDQRGTGHSKITNINADTMRLSLMVDDIEQLRQHLQLPTMTLLGHSFGGALAASYAARYPQQVEQLILSSAAGLDLQFRQHFSERLNANLTVAQRAMLLTYQARQAAGPAQSTLSTDHAALLAHGYVFDKRHAPAVAARLKVVNMQINQLVHADLTRQQYNLTKAFSNFQRPVLVLQGEQDVIDPTVGKATAAAFPHAQLTLLPHSVHYGWLDQPALFYQTLFNFLKQAS